MFDIGFPEFFLAAVVGLLVLGPQRLPNALRTLGLWLGRLRRSYYNVKTEIEREIGMDDVRRQLHNEQVMADVKRVERDVQAMGKEVADVADAAMDTDPPAQIEHPARAQVSATPPAQGIEQAPDAVTEPKTDASSRGGTAP